MRNFYNTLIPYKVIPYDGIEYTNCCEYDHISRYRGIREVIHRPTDPSERFISHETSNYFESHVDVDFYEVPLEEEHRLDLIAYKKLGSASYAWILAYFNDISDGYSCYQGQILAIPKSLYSLFNDGEVLQTVSPFALNLGAE